MGITKMVRRAVWKRIFEVSMTARAKAITLTTITVTSANPRVNR